MTDFENKPPAGVPGPRKTGESRPGGGSRETILLGENPDVPPLPAETVVSSPIVPALATNVLAALGQRYEILGEAGHGSMGNVYKARDLETGETVALKLLKPEIASDQAMMDRFKNELLFARKITHKNVCRVYEFNRVAGIAYTSMEFVEGESLRSVLNRFGALTQKKANDLALQICSGLKEAHAQGIVHRDLKPENVMIDGSGNLKLMDFGIARSMEALTRQTGAMVGTPAYMAPEQVSGSPVDYRTDIYSLGLMLYEMFTGKPAFSAENSIAVALKQMREEPAPPRTVDPSIPVPIERIILKCLEKVPAKRFQTVAELESALQTPSSAASLPQPAATHALRPALALTSTSPALAHKSTAGSSSASGLKVVLWVLFGSALVLATLAGLRWLAVTKAAQKIPPPASAPAPAPPEFSLEIPVVPATPATEPVEKNSSVETSTAKPAAPVQPPPAGHSKPGPPEVFPRMEVPPTRHTLPDPSKWIAAQKALANQAKQARQSKSTKQPQFVYLKTGMFAREEKAQEAAQKIRHLGLPAIVKALPVAAGDVYLTLCGPIAAGGEKAVTEQLRSDGFRGIQKVSPETTQ
jgi:serine/threonine protein kinase